MLENAHVYAYVPVSDLEKGRNFYEGVLGFKAKSEIPDVGVTYGFANDTAFFMYVSEGAGTNEASTLFWTVDDVKSTVDELRQAGVQPLDYDFGNGMKTVNGIMSTPDGKDMGAWFKDPDGNILAIIAA